ncbi:MAG TPA: hypothetical protein VFX80_10970, partial [Solirubrobacteraceae bacterium]|nr:hypothetical protein [Solirubrobacteraceae bacterium]
MILAAVVGDGHEIVLVQPQRALEDGSGDGDVRVEGEVAHDLRGRVADIGETLRQLDPRLEFEIARETQDHLVEHRDMRVLEVGRVLDEQAGHAPQGVDAPDRVPARDGIFDLADKGTPVTHDHST